MKAAEISVLVVDDEPLGRDLLRHMLAAHADVRVVGECADGEKALAAIKRHAPQVVFLDVKMPRLDGLGLLRKLPPESRPLIVFVTAHEAYALEAFEGRVFDYVLKPFDQERFNATLARVRERLAEAEAARLGESVRQLLMVDPDAEKRPPRGGGPVDRLVVRDRGRIHFVDTAEIAWLEASGNYVALRTRAGKTHLVHETMAAMEAKLDPAVFVRIHRSTIVNAGRILQLEPHFNGEFVVILDDGSRLKLSRTYADPARRALGLA